jgi:hypothetical protein
MLKLLRVKFYLHKVYKTRQLDINLAHFQLVPKDGYPDLTDQSTYPATIVNNIIAEDIFQEMDFLQKYDETKSAIQNIVDLPDRQIDQLIRLIHDNRSTLSKRRRDTFEKLTDVEIQKIEKTFQDMFEMPGES